MADPSHKDGHSGVRNRVGDVGKEHCGQKRKYPERLSEEDQNRVCQSMLDSASVVFSDCLAARKGDDVLDGQLLDDI